MKLKNSLFDSKQTKNSFKFPSQFFPNFSIFQNTVALSLKISSPFLLDSASKFSKNASNFSNFFFLPWTSIWALHVTKNNSSRQNGVYWSWTHSADCLWAAGHHLRHGYWRRNTVANWENFLLHTQNTKTQFLCKFWIFSNFLVFFSRSLAIFYLLFSLLFRFFFSHFLATF